MHCGLLPAKQKDSANKNYINSVLKENGTPEISRCTVRIAECFETV